MSPQAASTPTRREAEQRLAQRRLAPCKPSQTPMVWVAAAVAVGGLLSPVAGLLGVRPEAPLVWAGVVLVGWAFAWRQGRDELAEWLLLLTVAVAACGWAGAAWRSFAADELGRYAPRDAHPVCVEAVARTPGVVYPADPPSPFRAIPSTEQTVVEVQVHVLRDGDRWTTAEGRCEVTVAGRVESLRQGDRVRVFGQLARPSPAMNPGQHDAATAARAERRLSRVWAEAGQCLSVVDPAPAQGALADWRRQASEAIGRWTPAPSAPVTRAMVLGDAGAAPRKTIEAFRRAGVLHVLVVSGLHVGIVAALLPLLAAAGLAPRRVAWLGALLLVVAYAALVGGRPPALRAAYVAGAVCVAVLAGRRAIGFNSLAAAAVLVFCVAPGAWVSAGTRLSFLATAVLLGVAAVARRRATRPTPPLDRLVRSARSPAERLARASLSRVAWILGATLSVQLATWPLVASEFHLVSPAAGPLSLLIAPLAPVVVGVGLSTILLDAAGLWPLAWLAGQLAGGAAWTIDALVNSAAAMPAAGLYTAGPYRWWAGLWIAWLLAGGLIAAHAPARRGWIWRSGLAVAAAGVGPLLWETATKPPALGCRVLAVGHGASTLLRLPDGRNLLVDAGALGDPGRVADTIARALWAEGVTRLDAVVLTHADLDHYNALPGLLDRFRIDAVWTTALMFEPWLEPDHPAAPEALLDLLNERRVPIRELEFGDELEIGDVLVRVLHPDALGVLGSDNANSLVLGVEYSGRRLLLPGDLEGPGLERLLEQEPYRCDVLLAPHHGSQRSDPPGLAAWCQPKVVAISSGEPRQQATGAYDRRGARVLNTHASGMVRIELSAASVRTNAFADAPTEGHDWD
ncbi:ComEC/Rec2 family competence protein [Botrimarina sp.]|uniref:ComEC/Rec2 family competence protein n=1 Tax=Botrimarina sp. TaxID=2795802 RepID=UPI0032EF1147